MIESRSIRYSTYVSGCRILLRRTNIVSDIGLLKCVMVLLWKRYYMFRYQNKMCLLHTLEMNQTPDVDYSISYLPSLFLYLLFVKSHMHSFNLCCIGQPRYAEYFEQVLL